MPTVPSARSCSASATAAICWRGISTGAANRTSGSSRKTPPTSSNIPSARLKTRGRDVRESGRWHCRRQGHATKGKEIMLTKPNCPVIALEEHYWDAELTKQYTGPAVGREGEARK